MDCKSTVIQGYASHTSIAQHHCNLPHTGADLTMWVIGSVLLIIVGTALVRYARRSRTA